MKTSIYHLPTLFKYNQLYFLQQNTLKVSDNNLFSKLFILKTLKNMGFYIIILWSQLLKA